MQSVTQFTTYKEDSLACMNVVEMYCGDKNNVEANAACFVYGDNSTRLRFGCEDADCFGMGRNFGAGLGWDQGWADATPKPADGHYFTCYGFTGNADEEPIDPSTRPFASQDMLPDINDFTWLLENMNSLHDICYRQECNNDHYCFMDFTPMYLPLEAFFALVFTVEVAMRAFVSRR